MSDYCSRLGLFDCIHNFVVAATNNELTENQLTDFERLLWENDEACRMYFRYVQESDFLQRIFDAMPDENSPFPVIFPAEPPSPAATLTSPAAFWFRTATGLSFDWPVAYLISTVLIGIGLFIGSFFYVSCPQPVTSDSVVNHSAISIHSPVVARVTGMADCEFLDASTATFIGAYVPLGRKYGLSSGLMEITHDSGAKVILQGPCTYEVSSVASGFLSIGKLTAMVKKKGSEARVQGAGNQKSSNPQSSMPPYPLFSVQTPTATVTDLGTEFGVDVDDMGNTISHVFRGSVRLQAVSADGAPEGDGQVLHENESVRVENGNTRTGNARRVTFFTSAVDFVRKMPKAESPSCNTKIFDLVDVVAGGDGFSGRRNMGIDVLTGRMTDKQPQLAPNAFPWTVGSGKYHEVKESPYIDGVFVPNGSTLNPVQVDSAGHVWKECPRTTNMTCYLLWAGGKIPPVNPKSVPLTAINDVDYSAPGHGLIFLRPNKGITFDLKAIRDSNPGWKITKFFAVVGLTEVPGLVRECADFWILVDGEMQYRRRQINYYNRGFNVKVPIPPEGRFLTLIATDGGDGIGGDWLIFGDPRLELIEASGQRSSQNALKKGGP